jgi:hypothetical protein
MRRFSVSGLWAFLQRLNLLRVLLAFEKYQIMRRCLATPIRLTAAVVLIHPLPAFAQEQISFASGIFPNITPCRRPRSLAPGQRPAQLRLGRKRRSNGSSTMPAERDGAIFANSIDLIYVGPNPAINAYVKSRGTEVRTWRAPSMAAARS